MYTKILKAVSETVNISQSNDYGFSDEIEKTPLYKEVEKIVRSVSTKYFNGKTLYVGPYNYCSDYYDNLSIDEKTVANVNQEIIKRCDKLIRPFITDSGYSESSAFFSIKTGQLIISINIIFNENERGLPQFRVKMDNSHLHSRVVYSFTNDSLGFFDKIDDFMELLDCIKNFCNKMLKY